MERARVEHSRRSEREALVSRPGEHQAPRDIKCPLCREVWGGADLIDAMKQRLAREAVAPKPGRAGSDSHFGAKCGHCAARPIVGDRYRCVACAGWDLCATCFGHGQHAHHDFVRKPLVGDAWQPAPRARRRRRRRNGRPPAWRPVAGLGAAGLPPEALMALQYRDLGPDDYARLLELDEAPESALPEEFASLGAYLGGSLPKPGRLPLPDYETTLQAICPECAAPCLGEADGGDLAQYPCGHHVHRSCAVAAVDGRRSFACPACAAPTFPGLHRRPKPARRTDDDDKEKED